MPFTKTCPKCNSSMLGAKIEGQGLDPSISALYIVSAICPGCGARHGDFVYGGEENSKWRAIVAGYLDATHLKEEMLR